MYSLPDEFEWLDRLTANELARSRGVHRVTVFRWQKIGRLGPLDWSRTTLSQQRPEAPGSYLNLMAWVVLRAITINGLDAVLDAFNDTLAQMEKNHADAQLR